MNHIERRPKPPHEEALDPLHFYAAYVFGNVHERQREIAAVVSSAQRLGYPVRYWWLSQAMALEDAPDRLIVCVHHDSYSEEAGLDLYDALKDQEVQWDFLEAASIEEYCAYGRVTEGAHAVRMPDGTPLFPTTEERMR